MNKSARWTGTLLVIFVAIAAVGLLGTFGFGWHAVGGMGMSFGMMGGMDAGGIWGTTSAIGDPLSSGQAEGIAGRHIAEFENPNLELAELMEFDNHFYAQARETETGRYAFEFLVDRFSGRISAEPGPNMMWNEKYGHMGGGLGGLLTKNEDEMQVTGDEAIAAAQEYLDRYGPGLQADDHTAAFYGYYTLHTLRDGEIVGMLSVNGYTGAVWLHSWHGVYLSSLDGEIH